MNLFIFNFEVDRHLVYSFLESTSKAHTQVLKSENWFYWKFRDNPFGESILACAEENGIIVGCVALGMQDFICNQKVIKGAMSFETFVHPEYQGKGLFKKLIYLAEEEATRRGIQFLLNFPNSQSLPGFLRLNWTKLDSPEYWIKPINLSRVIMNLNHLPRSFQPNLPNFDRLSLNTFSTYIQLDDKSFYPVINRDYLAWRFLKYPVAEYSIVDDVNFYALARNGKRGCLAETQILFISPKHAKKISLSKVLSSLEHTKKADLISMPISKNNTMRNLLKRNFFIQVPNKTNVCYKILDASIHREMDKFEFSAISFHTY